MILLTDMYTLTGKNGNSSKRGLNTYKRDIFEMIQQLILSMTTVSSGKRDNTSIICWYIIFPSASE